MTEQRHESRRVRSEIGGGALIRVKQQRMDEDVFMQRHAEVLATWPTGKEVDLEEAVAYHKSLPDGKKFHKILQRVRAEGRISLFPRQGTPLVDREIELIRSLNELGIHLLPLTTDSYTRNLQLDKVEKGLAGEHPYRQGGSQRLPHHQPRRQGQPQGGRGVRRGPRPPLVAHRTSPGG